MPAPVHLITALIRISFIFWFSFLPFYGILLFLFTAGHSYPMLLSCRFFPVYVAMLQYNRILHFFLVEVDTVTKYREYRTRSHDVVIKSLFFQRVVLRQSGLIHQVHRLIHSVADILVIRCQREEKVVEHFYMAFRFHVKRFLHRGPLYQNGYIAVQYIHFLLGICHHHPCRPDARQADEHTSGKKKSAEYRHQLDFVL